MNDGVEKRMLIVTFPTIEMARLVCGIIASRHLEWKIVKKHSVGYWITEDGSNGEVVFTSRYINKMIFVRHGVRIMCRDYITWRDDPETLEKQIVDFFYEKEDSMNWNEIRSITEMALLHGKDVSINIDADGSRQIEISTPTECVVEQNSKSTYYPDNHK